MGYTGCAFSLGEAPCVAWSPFTYLDHRVIFVDCTILFATAAFFSGDDPRPRETA